MLIEKSDIIADLVKDPHNLAEEIHKAGLISREERDTLTSDCTKDDRSKAHEIVGHIVTKVSIDPHLSPIALMVLSRLPGVQDIIKESSKMIVMLINKYVYIYVLA